MAISPNNTITYGDLVNAVRSYILSTCKNIGTAWTSAVPTTFRPGGSLGTIVSVYSKVQGGINASAPITATAAVGANSLGLVTQSTIESQFNSFMTSRGIMSRTDQLVTTKGLLHFYNSISAFFSVRVVVVTNSMVPNTRIIFYNAGTVTYPTVPDGSGGSNSELIEAADINALLDNLNSVLAQTTKGYAVPIVVSSVTSCCSSSSSSSSCSSSCSSSSSSSSSSSWFIGYMKL